MTLEYHDQFKSPMIVPATQVIVRDVFGDPLMVCYEQMPGVYCMAHRGEPNFPDVLQSLGLPSRLVTEHLTAPQPTRSLVLPG